MPVTSGTPAPSPYPIPTTDLFIATRGATTWDDGATTWDTARTKWDAALSGVTRVIVNNQPTPRYVTDPATGLPMPANPFTANLARAKLYGQMWAALRPWKKVRWTACARLRNLTGRALYLQCAYAQNIPGDAQPISPCSRRATDPAASPFDWTP